MKKFLFNLSFICKVFIYNSPIWAFNQEAKNEQLVNCILHNEHEPNLAKICSVQYMVALKSIKNGQKAIDKMCSTNSTNIPQSIPAPQSSYKKSCPGYTG